MLRRLFPKQEDFFILFSGISSYMVKATEEFHNLVNHLDQAEQYIQQINTCEQDADKIVKQAFDKLHHTFITPFDRHDIHQLITSLDDVIDGIDRLTRKFSLYKITQTTSEVIFLSSELVLAAKVLHGAVDSLSSLKYAEQILKACSQVRDINSASEQLLLTSTAALFASESDFKKMLEHKDIQTGLEKIFRACQNAANVINGIVWEYS